MDNKSSFRWGFLALGVLALLFGGILYGWSILKAPLADDFGWGASELALNFTITMCCFCLGGFVGGNLSRRIGVRASLLIAAALALTGFLMASRMSGDIIMLYLSYGVVASLGIGIAYNVVISTVSAWFPDKKGTCSGALMMGFGISSLLIGNIASLVIEGPGWRTAYLGLGVALGIVFVISAILLRLPGEGDTLPEAEATSSASTEDFETRDFTTAQMIRRPTFWRAFFCIVFLAAVGNTVISFARDLALSVGAAASLATTLVGVLSLCNGLGRVLTGTVFDRIGRRKTMILANIIAIAAAAVTLIAVSTGSLTLCVLGLCVTGFSYGASPTITSAFTSAFYGTRHFALNFSVMNFNLMAASFVATAASSLFESTGGYTAPFILLLALSLISLALNFSIRRP